MYRGETKTKGRRDSRRGTWSREEDQIIIDSIGQVSSISYLSYKIQPLQSIGQI